MHVRTRQSDTRQGRLSRVGAKQLPEFMEDLTPPEEYERAKQAAAEHSLARQQGVVGRPTKKLRRDIAKLLGFD